MKAGKIMKAKLKKIFQFIANPHLLLCVAIAWLITNGWSYIMLALGTFFKIDWMMAVSGAYVAFLWLPLSPEKLVTFAIAIVLLRWIFPNDQKTLAVLKELHAKAKKAFKLKKKDNKENENDKSDS